MVYGFTSIFPATVKKGGQFYDFLFTFKKDTVYRVSPKNVDLF